MANIKLGEVFKPQNISYGDISKYSGIKNLLDQGKIQLNSELVLIQSDGKENLLQVSGGKVRFLESSISPIPNETVVVPTPVRAVAPAPAKSETSEDAPIYKKSGTECRWLPVYNSDYDLTDTVKVLIRSPGFKIWVYFEQYVGKSNRIYWELYRNDTLLYRALSGFSHVKKISRDKAEIITPFTTYDDLNDNFSLDESDDKDSAYFDRLSKRNPGFFKNLNM